MDLERKIEDTLGQYVFQQQKLPFYMSGMKLLSHQDPQQTIIQIVQQIFSDPYIYQHKKMYQKITKRAKGQIELEEISEQPIFVKTLQQIQIKVPNKDQLKHIIIKKSQKLLCNRKNVYRREPFKDRLSTVKPIYIEQYPQNDGNQELLSLLNSKTSIYRMIFRHEQNWAIVYAQNEEKILQLNGHVWSTGTKFRVEPYQKAISYFQLSRSNWLWRLKNNYNDSQFEKIVGCFSNSQERMEEQFDRRNRFRYKDRVSQQRNINLENNLHLKALYPNKNQNLKLMCNHTNFFSDNNSFISLGYEKQIQQLVNFHLSNQKAKNNTKPSYGESNSQSKEELMELE